MVSNPLHSPPAGCLPEAPCLPGWWGLLLNTHLSPALQRPDGVVLPHLQGGTGEKWRLPFSSTDGETYLPWKGGWEGSSRDGWWDGVAGGQGCRVKSAGRRTPERNTILLFSQSVERVQKQ